MKLGSKGRYAVMAMVDLAFHGDGRPVSLAEIALRQEISLSYLEQLFARLRREGLIVSARGPGGGYRLARPASTIAVVEVVDAVDESLRITRCPKGAPPTRGCMTDRSRCLTHDLWADLGDHMRAFLASVTLDDVCRRHKRSSRAIAAE
jgi:Rrf2 family iron-sulfur cluster assembly transcriptional regulator